MQRRHGVLAVAHPWAGCGRSRGPGDRGPDSSGCCTRRGKRRRYPRYWTASARVVFGPPPAPIGASPSESVVIRTQVNERVAVLRLPARRTHTSRRLSGVPRDSSDPLGVDKANARRGTAPGPFYSVQAPRRTNWPWGFSDGTKHPRITRGCTIRPGDVVVGGNPCARRSDTPRSM